MRLLSISVGQPQKVRHQGKDVLTAIYKSPVAGPVLVRTTGIDGDRQANPEVHGGPDKTVLSFAIENYPFYQERFGLGDLPHGFFGENLTTSGITETGARIGDRYRAGDALLEVTMPRSPCFKFGLRLGASEAQRACLESGCTGIYFRVLEPGAIAAGDHLILIRSDPDAPSVHEIHRLRFFDKRDAPSMRRALGMPALAQVVRAEFETRLSELDQPA